MAKYRPDERLVYLALKHVFKGKGAQERDPEKIRKQIEIHRAEKEIGTLIAKHTFNNIFNTAKNLLVNEVFTSSQKAKIRFPEVFKISPAPSVELASSESEAARSGFDVFAEASARVNELDLARKGKSKEMSIYLHLINRSLAHQF
jgi:hypothetical protein